MTGCAFSKKKTSSFLNEAKGKAPYDAIIVPGVPFKGEHWSDIMKYRVQWSFYLLDNQYSNNVIYSGGAVYTPYSESKIMAEYAKVYGIDPQRIFTDTLAEHSTENVYYSYRLAKEQGFEKIALATDQYQAKLLRRMIKHFELPVDLLPIVVDTMKTKEFDSLYINPAPALKPNFVSIKDRESFFTRLGGTFGKHLIFYEEDLPKEKMIKKYRKKGRLIESPQGESVLN
jgi:uncharacterized SAM-binding protein YcdF (DUF218 family)